MLSIQGVAVTQGADIRSSPIVRPLPRSLHAGNYTSYARSMTPEVISNIFGFTSHSSCDPISQSIAISHVCRQWRRISLSMPSLWTPIFLSFPLTKGQLVRTSTWILRSRDRPLDIYMDFRDPSWDWNEASHIFGSKAMENIMRFLLPHAPRWQSVELLTDTWAPIFAFLTCTVAIDSVPLLQSIRLARCNEYFVAQGEAFRPACLALPIAWFRGGASLRHLRRVSLSGVHVDWARSGLAGLRELELRYHARDVMPTLSVFRRILRANAGLERLVLLGWGPQMDDMDDDDGVPVDKRGCDDPQPINLPRLEVFEFGFVDVTYAVRLLSLFALPSLSVFSVEDVAFGIQLCERQDCSRLFDRLVAMMDASSSCVPLSSLLELSLRSIRADDASIRRLFGHLRDMTSLRLDRVDVASLLAMCSALRDACGRLELLTLGGIDATAVSVVLTSCSFLSRPCIFLDVGDADRDGEGDMDCDDVGDVMGSL